jgi:hypothetical protein
MAFATAIESSRSQFSAAFIASAVSNDGLDERLSGRRDYLRTTGCSARAVAAS